MENCPSCGAALRGGNFCPACGRSLVGAAPGYTPYQPPLREPGASPAPVVAAPQTQRPVGVVLAAVGFFLIAAGLGIVALLTLVMTSVASALVNDFLPWAGFAGLFAVIAVVVLAVAGFAAAVGVGLLQGRQWAWIVALVWAGLAVLGNLMELASMDPGGVVGALIWGGLIYYFLRPEVRAWFGQAPARSA